MSTKIIALDLPITVGSSVAYYAAVEDLGSNSTGVLLFNVSKEEVAARIQADLSQKEQDLAKFIGSYASIVSEKEAAITELENNISEVDSKI
jgi:hypothetical protein